MYDDAKWIGYIKESLPKFDYTYSGNRWTLKCFKKHDSKVKKIRLLRGISSTLARDNMLKNKNWEKLVPDEVAGFIRKIKGVERIRRIYSKK